MRLRRKCGFLILLINYCQLIIDKNLIDVHNPLVSVDVFFSSGMDAISNPVDKLCSKAAWTMSIFSSDHLVRFLPLFFGFQLRLVAWFTVSEEGGLRTHSNITLLSVRKVDKQQIFPTSNLFGREERRRGIREKIFRTVESIWLTSIFSFYLQLS